MPASQRALRHDAFARPPRDHARAAANGSVNAGSMMNRLDHITGGIGSGHNNWVP